MIRKIIILFFIISLFACENKDNNQIDKIKHSSYEIKSMIKNKENDELLKIMQEYERNNISIFEKFDIYNLFTIAVESNNEEIIEVLIQGKEDISNYILLKDMFIYCIKKKQEKIFGILEEATAKFNWRDNLFIEIIQYYCSNDEDIYLKDVLKYFKKYSLSEIDFENYLISNLHKYNERIIKILVDYGLDLNMMRNNPGYSDHRDTLLSLAVTNRDLNYVIKLIKNGANIYKGRFLEVVFRFNYTNISDYLFENGLDINKTDDLGNPIIFWTVAKSSHEGVSEQQNKMFFDLINKGAKIDVKNNKNQCILHYAMNPGNSEVVKYLLENRIDPNQKDNDGNTPLHNLCSTPYNFDKEILELMINYGADINIKNDKGETPASLAKGFGEII